MVELGGEIVLRVTHVIDIITLNLISHGIIVVVHTCELATSKIRLWSIGLTQELRIHRLSIESSELAAVRTTWCSHQISHVLDLLAITH